MNRLFSPCGRKQAFRTQPVALFATLLVGIVTTSRLTAAQDSSDAFKIDFRYSPSSWQTAICLPDDWQKTLVGKDAALLYDYPGRQSGFGTRIRFESTGLVKFVSQELVSPRVPIVRTVQRDGDLEIMQEAFALAPPVKRARKAIGFSLERVGAQTGQQGWASPPTGTDPAFRDVAIGWNEPIHFRFKAERGKPYLVGFGLCEGYHEEAGRRVLKLEAEGGPPRTVDMVAQQGRNQPEVFTAAARDTNGDGWIDLKVSASQESSDKNTILNTLWVFPGAAAPPPESLRAGTATGALAHINCAVEQPSNRPPRHDLVLVRVRNTGTSERSFAPQIRIERDAASPLQADTDVIALGRNASLQCSEPIRTTEHDGAAELLRPKPTIVLPGGEKMFCLAIAHGQIGGTKPLNLTRSPAYRAISEQYWRNLPLPYDRLQVPDPGVQALVDSSIRNIYQAREIKQGLPAFQVGPTCYRGLWVVDGSFLLEAVTYLGRASETRRGVEYLMSFQRPDGGFMLMDGHWKETGIALWAISRHAQLTSDKQWLRSVWPKVQRGFEFIRHMRQMPAADAPNARLIPDGFSDGGLADKVPEYTNIYWTMAGMRAAIAAAHWLGEERQAEVWQHEYDDFFQTFRRAAARDSRKDAVGNSYLPIRMQKGEGIPPQKAQWAFLHALFPGKVFDANDPLVTGNTAMLRAVEYEGLVRDTGWLKSGIWTYFGSFYGHAWLWLGDGRKAVQTLYAFGNHASPLMVWREEQMPAGEGSQVVGDMPHNWASAEFIRQVRHLMILERGNELHLFEGVPQSWFTPGALIKAKEIATEFGPISLEFRVNNDGSSGTIRLTPPRRAPAGRIILHTEGWSAEGRPLTLPSNKRSQTIVRLHPSPN